MGRKGLYTTNVFLYFYRVRMATAFSRPLDAHSLLSDGSIWPYDNGWAFLPDRDYRLQRSLADRISNRKILLQQSLLPPPSDLPVHGNLPGSPILVYRFADQSKTKVKTMSRMVPVGFHSTNVGGVLLCRNC